ncbi:MAG: imidazole glycerol phosphate synthase subunit HisF [Treponema sp.]|jgi:cyclase|nr:imidazole glycerol phosphate synthase subunit HisF [Treponema sp.]
MQAKRIIPCLDVDDGRVVKGVKFKGIRDAGDPVDLARRYNDQGADELTFLDIGASYKSRATLLDVVSRVAAEVFIPLCVGGGIRSAQDMRDAMNAGADKVSVCTAALKNPGLISEMARAYGSQCVVLSLDAKRAPREDAGPDAPDFTWHAFSHGGREDTGIDAVAWAIQAVELGAGEILLNSIDADGTGSGYDRELTEAILRAVPVPVIASGGAGTLDQIARILLPREDFPGTAPAADPSPGKGPAGGADAALVASLLHFEKTTIREIKKYAESKGVCVRW